MHRAIAVLIAAFSVGLLIGTAQEADAKKKGRTFLYIHDNPATSQIYAFEVEKDGSLVSVPGSPYSLGEGGSGCSSQCYTLAYDPGRKLLFASTTEHITVFSVGKDGVLTQVGLPHEIPERTIGLATVKRGKKLFLYGTEYDHDRVRGYEVQADGTLVQVPTTPVDTGDRPDTLVAAGKRIFVYSEGEGVHVFTVANEGSLTEVAGSPFPVVVNFSYYLATDPKGKHLYVPDAGDEQVLGFSIASKTGVLTPLAGSPFVGNAAPEFGLAVGTKHAFAADNVFGTSIQAYTRNAKTGVLTAQGPRQDPGLDSLDGIALSPDGKFLATWSGFPDALRTHSVGADGALTLADEVAVALESFNTSGALFLKR